MHAAVPRESGVLASVIDEIDGFIAAALSRRDLPCGLDAAIRYSALDGGKRLRPALLLLSCEAVGGDRARAS
jgi:geranylgeranyl pyrophosphate synthase